MSVGWELASFSVLGVGLGLWADKKFGSSPWGVLVGAFSGIAIGLYRLIRSSGGAQDGSSGRR